MDSKIDQSIPQNENGVEAFLNRIQEIGYKMEDDFDESDFEKLSQDPKFQNLFNFLGQSLSFDNCLTEEEKTKADRLVPEGTVDELLENAANFEKAQILKSLGITDTSEEDLNQQLEEQKNLEKLLEAEEKILKQQIQQEEQIQSNNSQIIHNKPVSISTESQQENATKSYANTVKEMSDITDDIDQYIFAFEKFLNEEGSFRKDLFVQKISKSTMENIIKKYDHLFQDITQQLKYLFPNGTIISEIGAHSESANQVKENEAELKEINEIRETISLLQQSHLQNIDGIIYNNRANASIVALQDILINYKIPSTATSPDYLLQLKQEFEAKYAEATEKLSNLLERKVQEEIRQITEKESDHPQQLAIEKGQELLEKHQKVMMFIFSLIENDKNFAQHLFDNLTKLHSEIESDILQFQKELVGHNEIFQEVKQIPNFDSKMVIDERDTFISSVFNLLSQSQRENFDSKKLYTSLQEITTQLNNLYQNWLKLRDFDNTTEIEARFYILKELVVKIFSSAKFSKSKSGKIEPIDLMNQKFLNTLEIVSKQKDSLDQELAHIEAQFRRQCMQELYEDEKTGLSINTLYVDFMLNEAKLVNKRLQELEKYK